MLLLNVFCLSIVSLGLTVNGFQFPFFRRTTNNCEDRKYENICDSVTCENGGTCVPEQSNRDCFRCECSSTFTGPRCSDRVITSLSCPENYCQNSGICIVENDIPVCLCLPIHTGERCEIGIFENQSRRMNRMEDEATDTTDSPSTDETTDSPSTDEATDSPSTGETTTSPSTGETTKSPSTGETTKSPSTGETTKSPSTGETTEPTSTVPQSITSTPTTAPITRPNIGCSTRPCRNGGTCYNNANSFFCFCPLGYTGIYCETRNTSITISTTTASPPRITCTSSTCVNGGTCFNNGNDVFCLCRVGFTGNRCQTVNPEAPTTTTTTVAPIVTCASRPCINGGTCYNNGNGYFCFCPSGFTGRNCDQRNA